MMSRVGKQLEGRRRPRSDGFFKRSDRFNDVPDEAEYPSLNTR